LPSGTAFCIGVVLIVMMTGRLVQDGLSVPRKDRVWIEEVGCTLVLLRPP